MFPAATAATFAWNVVHRGLLVLFQFLSGLATFSNGLSRPLTVCGTGRDGAQVVDSRRLKGAVRSGTRSIRDASTLPPGPSGSDGVPRVSHALIKDWDVFHVLSRFSLDETDGFGAHLNISCLLINLKYTFWCLILNSKKSQKFHILTLCTFAVMICDLKYPQES